ncbi:Crp/Fnr family transcriptional regulator [Pseudorhodoferax sp.]|uniref:Crp/Fnr family transcriptional regulator n=1 Tax=Pseudorhodoferax sp. TaxID=1993553 RepID=UPI002DD6388F|nr:Crp/Fnr family transcriptional regulator [Pseudorhodoferax sp.]
MTLHAPTHPAVSDRFAPLHALVWRPEPGSSAQHRSWTLERPHPPSVPPTHQRTLLAADWLAEVGANAREALMAALSVTKVAAGDQLLHQGEHSALWYGVASGAVRLGSVSASGRQLSTALVAPGEWFGEGAALGRLAEACSAHAHADSVLVSLRFEALRRLTAAHADLRHALLRWSSARQRAAMDAVAHAATAPLSQRLAACLLDLGRRFGQPQDEGFHLALPLTQTDLAQLVATSRQRLNQGVQDLRRIRVLETRDNQISVLSTEVLQRRAGLFG